jgi:hypothetical protein
MDSTASAYFSTANCCRLARDDDHSLNFREITASEYEKHQNEKHNGGLKTEIT